MDSRISMAARPDVVLIESSPRPTPTPVRVSFGQVLAAGASSLIQGAELAAGRLPGAPMAVAAVRAGGSTALPIVNPGGSSAAVAEGPVGSGTSAIAANAGSLGPNMTGVMSGGVAGPITTGASSDSTSGIDASLQQSAQMNLYYLQVQQEVDSQNRSFTALSNVLKTEHDSAKAAIQNVHS